MGRGAPASRSRQLTLFTAGKGNVAALATRPRARKRGELIDAHVTSKGRLDVTRVIRADADALGEEITSMWVRATASGLVASTKAHAQAVPCRVTRDRGRYVLHLVGKELRKLMAARDLGSRPVVVQLRHRMLDGALNIEIVRYGRPFSLPWMS